MSHEELVSVSAEIANGILSADSSLLSKVIDRTFHDQIAASAVSIAYKILTEIEKVETEK